MDLQMVKVTPSVAAQMLEQNTEINRSIRHGHLEKLCYDMKHGLWDSNNGETLKFKDPENDAKWGEMVDGQHRLTAIIQTGKTFTLPCLIGVSEDSFATLDSGSSRTFADILAQKGHVGTTSLAGGVATLEQFYIGNFRKKQLSHRALLARFEKHPNIAEYVTDFNRLRKVFRPSEAIFLSYVIQSIAPKKGAQFIQRLATGGSTEGTPVHEVRERLLNLRIKGPTGHKVIAKDYVIGSVFKAWNMTERKSKEDFTMLGIGESIEYPVGFIKVFDDIDIGGIER